MVVSPPAVTWSWTTAPAAEQPQVPETLMKYVPGGVVGDEVEILMVVVQLGVHEAGENVTLTPGGSEPVVWNVITSGVPDFNVAVRRSETELPWLTYRYVCPLNDHENPGPPEGVVIVTFTSILAENPGELAKTMNFSVPV